MAGKSNIEWTGHTWNPLAGCSVLSPGCQKCYAMRLAKRLGAMGNPLYKGLTKDVNGNTVWTGEMRKAPRHVLQQPLHRKKPTMWFVNSMSDLFHENVRTDWIVDVFSVMAKCPQHTFQILTKRPGFMQAFVLDREVRLEVAHRANARIAWPLPNVWLGTSTERQKEADERIPFLLDTPAAVRFISAEPLLGQIDLEEASARAPDEIDWVIVGGESGRGHRDMDPAWAKSLIDQCVGAGVAVFMKQMAGKKPIPPELAIRQYPVVANA